MDCMVKYNHAEGKSLQDKKKYVESGHNRNDSGEYTYKSGTVYGGKEVVLGFPEDEKPERFFPETASGAHDKYHAKHAKDMGITMKQWLQDAAAVLNSQKDEHFFDWYNREEKKFYRYEKSTARLAIGTKSGLISTFFVLQKKHRKIYLPKEYLDIL